MTKRKRKSKTIGEMTNSRGTWQINPITRVKEGKRKYESRKKAKQKIKNGEYE